MKLTLPYPPSANRMWRSIVVGGHARVLLSREARAYRDDVRIAVGVVKRLCQPVAVRIEVYPPDARRRDLDNTIKAVCDAMTHVGVWDDDHRVADLHVVRMVPSRDPRLEVTVTEIE